MNSGKHLKIMRRILPLQSQNLCEYNPYSNFIAKHFLQSYESQKGKKNAHCQCCINIVVKVLNNETYCKKRSQGRLEATVFSLLLYLPKYHWNVVTFWRIYSSVPNHRILWMIWIWDVPKRYKIGVTRVKERFRLLVMTAS